MDARARLQALGDDRLERALLAEVKGVLRVVSSSHVFAGHGAILKNSSGSQETYDLSVPAQKIPWFISHSWRTGRWTKALGLALFLHMRLAFMCSVACLVVSSVIILLTSRADLCTTNDTTAWLGDVMRASLVPVLPAVAFAVVSLYGHLLPCPGGRTECFLDKICIHQTDAALKKQAIDSLDVFLRFSSRMLVLYSPEYLSRLWCTYELATFTELNGAARIDFVPHWCPIFVLLSHSAVAAVLPAYSFLVTGPVFAALTARIGASWGYLLALAAAIAPTAALGSAFIYLKVWYHTQMLTQLRGFRLAHAQCYDPRDRVFVHGLIELMWGAALGGGQPQGDGRPQGDGAAVAPRGGQRDHDSQRDDGKQRFEHFVRVDLPLQLEAALGARTRLPYHVALITFLPLLSVCLMLSLVCDGHMVEQWGYEAHARTLSSSWTLRWILYGFELWCFANPVATVCVQLALSRLVDAGRGALVCVAAGSIVYCVTLWPLISVIVGTLMYQPEERSVAPALVGGTMLAMLTAACWRQSHSVRKRE